ncbi:ABC transporter [Thalassobaculum fulvum]|uniref:ABC transporter n=1 Tax=Thalassobaculum fulvum TaxID=1633335 RepID=A0A919CPJ1_9PROT|nr:ABC-F family ATP-binding cassette domain-containing protein [Thalassobaculum fulvum]GHD43395.1 ABC transporter [Thalassobaculum fulvum]
MTLISLTGLGVTLGAPLFQDLTFSLAKGDRLGLVAANGRGKSTLLRCLADRLEPSAGRIVRARGLRTALVRQDNPDALLPLTLRAVALDGLPADTRDWEAWRADVTLDELAVPDDLRDRPLAELSGGWRRMAQLARARVAEPDLLLLDEPTNHLDLERIAGLEAWIAGLPGDMALIVASHDRAFLDAVTTRTLFLRERGSQLYALPFSPARQALAKADAATARRHAADLQEAAKLRRQAAKLNNIGINSGSDLLQVKTRQLKARAERIEEAAQPAHRELSAGTVRLSDGGAHVRALLVLDGAEVGTPDGRPLFRTGRLAIAPGDRVVVLGANGAGKSRLLAAVASAVEGMPAPGFWAAGSIVPGICDQELTRLDRDRTPFELVAGRFEIGDQRARSLLAGAGVGLDLQVRPVAALSGGQRARLAMLVLRLQRPNFYMLDEPTNHLDIEGQEALEAELCAREAACLLVSHDRRFVENVGNRFWRIEGKRLIELDGPPG